MSTNHTPGPWQLADRKNPWWIVRTLAGEYIAEVECDPDAPDESRANALLIAAAPRMFLFISALAKRQCSCHQEMTCIACASRDIVKAVQS
jgi:hypothetical protein